LNTCTLSINVSVN